MLCAGWALHCAVLQRVWGSCAEQGSVSPTNITCSGGSSPDFVAPGESQLDVAALCVHQALLVWAAHVQMLLQPWTRSSHAAPALCLRHLCEPELSQVVTQPLEISRSVARYHGWPRTLHSPVLALSLGSLSHCPPHPSPAQGNALPPPLMDTSVVVL